MKTQLIVLMLFALFTLLSCDSASTNGPGKDTTEPVPAECPGSVNGSVGQCCDLDTAGTCADGLDCEMPDPSRGLEFFSVCQCCTLSVCAVTADDMWAWTDEARAGCAQFF